ncbi:hypothetical protein VSR34_28550 [Paraburkholderia sp. JHI2823]|uniref:hypothetical protein n=1 Tax=Paraburkholderia TaxID=1822464 RepID=UPI0003FE390C|nr:hypothetical protein [Paraburkholderia mimosarum]
MSEKLNTTKPEPVAVAIALHPGDYASLQDASRAVGMSEAAFCALAIHHASRAVMDSQPPCKII